MEETIKAAEGFYTSLYASDVRLWENTERTSLACDVPLVRKGEQENPLKT